MKRLTCDFTALFNAFWYRDFPISDDHKPFGSRAEWTIHIGICVRSCADLLGYFTHFEAGNRTDAVIRDNTGQDVVHVEWEWWNPRNEKVNEIEKLRSGSDNADLSVLITYSDLVFHDENLSAIRQQWGKSTRPLLVLLITYQKSGKRFFENLETHHVQNGTMKKLRSQPALPWNNTGTRWERVERNG
jgi:hypothetical protein